MSLAQILLRDKRDKQQEYTLHLFEKCNLSCSFCWQDHSAYDGVDTVREKLQPLKELLDAETMPKVIINVMGGEVFDDSIYSPELFSDYMYLAIEGTKYANQLGKEMVVSFVTNLVTDHPERLAQLIDDLKANGVNAQLVTSYDSKGRFNKRQFEIFKQNMVTLRPYISSVSMLLTKPVIKELMAFKDPYFQEMYDAGYEIYFDYYTPTTGWTNTEQGSTLSDRESHMVIGPSDKDLLVAFCFLVDNYPNCQPIKGWIQNNTNPLSCRSSKLILADGTKCMCGNLHLNNPQLITFYNAKIKPNDNDEIEDNFVKRWDCITCEYFQRCQLACFMQHDFSKRGQMVECPFKLTFDKITKGIEPDFDNITTYFGKKHDS